MSLTFLNLSRSMSKIVNGSPRRRWRAAASSIFWVIASTICQTGQRIVVRHKRNPLLRFLSFGNVIDYGNQIFWDRPSASRITILLVACMRFPRSGDSTSYSL